LERKAPMVTLISIRTRRTVDGLGLTKPSTVRERRVVTFSF
jgi:hypothetical protein